ncbi:hypothetical protein NY08_3894 [Rhodococcus sp. B7740]|nr:hypothetical protein NY08_3894 [Rhodococcus sp. B7740]
MRDAAEFYIWCGPFDASGVGDRLPEGVRVSRKGGRSHAYDGVAVRYHTPPTGSG